MEYVDLIFASYEDEDAAFDACEEVGIAPSSFCAIAKAIRAEPESVMRVVMACELLGKRGHDLIPVIMRSTDWAPLPAWQRFMTGLT